MYESSADRGVDPAAHEAQDLLGLADFLLNVLDREVLAARRRVRAREAHHTEEEVFNHRCAVDREVDLGMELHTIQLALLVLDGGDELARGGDDAEALRHRGDRVAMREEHFRRLREAIKQGA